MKESIGIASLAALALLFVGCSEPCDGPCDGERIEADTGDGPDVFVPREGHYQFNVFGYSVAEEDRCGMAEDSWSFPNELTLTENGYSLQLDDFPVTFENCVLVDRDFACDAFDSELFSLAKGIPEGQGIVATLALTGKWWANGVGWGGELAVTYGTCTALIPAEGS